MSDAEETRQTTIQPFDELNRYDGRHEEYPSAEVFEPPRRTMANYWVKLHAARDCGRRNVRFVEENSHHSTSERYEYDLVCWSCGYEIPETEVLFIGGDWWHEHGWRTYGRMLDDIHIPPERVLELGPDPDEADLETVLELGRIERESGSLWHPFHTDTTRPCGDCGHEVPIMFDGRCRMCYDGPWTDRLQRDVEIHANRVREWANNSYGHKAGQYVDPMHPGDGPSEGEVLWRRHAQEPAPKLAIVTNRFEDIDDGHREYELSDPTYTTRTRYRAADIADCFWSTGLYDRHHEGTANDDIRHAYQRVCDHSFNVVHRETEDGYLVPDGRQCIHCRLREGETPGGDSDV